MRLYLHEISASTTAATHNGFCRLRSHMVAVALKSKMPLATSAVLYIHLTLVAKAKLLHMTTTG